MNKGTISVLSMFMGVMAGVWISGKIERSKRKKAEAMSGKFTALFHMMNQWVKIKQEGKNLSNYFEVNQYKRVAIYGMSYVGGTLVRELMGTETDVVYGIDKRVFGTNMGIDVVSPDEILDNVDVIIVTAINFFDEIAEKLREKVDCPVISIEDILFQV